MCRGFELFCRLRRVSEERTLRRGSCRGRDIRPQSSVRCTSKEWWIGWGDGGKARTVWRIVAIGAMFVAGVVLGVKLIDQHHPGPSDPPPLPRRGPGTPHDFGCVCCGVLRSALRPQVLQPGTVAPAVQHRLLNWLYFCGRGASSNIREKSPSTKFVTGARRGSLCHRSNIPTSRIRVSDEAGAGLESSARPEILLWNPQRAPGVEPTPGGKS